MEKIRLKIRELLDVSEPDLIGDKNFCEKFEAKMKRQHELMDELDVIAKANKTILGRTIRFPMADSYALYLVTKVHATTVQINWLNYCDGHVDDRAGYATKLSRKYVEQSVFGRDRIDELFKAKKAVRV